MAKQKKEDFAKWKADLDARHAEYARQAEELEAQIQADLDKKYPPELGWIKVGSVRARLRLKNKPMPSIGEYI